MPEISKFEDVNIEQLQKIVNKNISELDTICGNVSVPLNSLTYIKTVYFPLSPFSSCYYDVGWGTIIPGFFGIKLWTQGEGTTNAVVKLYNAFNDTIIQLSQSFIPGTIIDAPNDINGYASVYDFPEGWTQAGLVVFNKNTGSCTRYNFGYHTGAFGRNGGNYIFLGRVHGGVFNYVDVFNRVNNTFSTLTVFDTQYPIIFGQYSSYDNIIAVTGRNYYGNQTSCPISLIDVNTLSVIKLNDGKEISGDAGVGSGVYYYKNKVFLWGGNYIYEYSVSPFQLVATYALPNTNYKGNWGILGPLNALDTSGEPLLILVNPANGAPCTFYVFNFENRQFKFVDWSSQYPGISGYFYSVHYNKPYLAVIKNCSSTMTSVPPTLYLYKVEGSLWEVI